MPPIVDLFQLHAIAVHHAIGGDCPGAALDQVEGRGQPVYLFERIHRHTAAVDGQGMVFPRLLQLGEVGDDRGPLAAKGEVDEILDVRQAQLAGHGLELFALTLAETAQPLGQVVQLVHVDALGHQPLEDGVLAVQRLHPAVLGGGGTDIHGLQQINGVVILGVRDREGDGDLPVSWLGLVAEDRFEDHAEHFLFVK